MPAKMADATMAACPTAKWEELCQMFGLHYVWSPLKMLSGVNSGTHSIQNEALPQWANNASMLTPNCCSGIVCAVVTSCVHSMGCALMCLQAKVQPWKGE